MRKSVGIIPYRINTVGEIVFFLGYPGGNLNKHHWAYLKGGIEEGESEIDTAIREFYEESGISLEMCKDDLVYVGQVLQNKNKQVTAYAVNLTEWFDIDPTTCYSNMTEYGWPEMDRYAWLTYHQVLSLTNPKHYPFYEKIMEIIKSDKQYGG